MAQIIGSGGIQHANIHLDEAAFPFNLNAGVLQAHTGKAMSLDTTTDVTAKLAVLDERIIGSLQTFENRVQEGIKVGTIAMQGGFQFSTVGVVAIGNSVVGAVSGTPAVGGFVKASAAVRSDNIVTAVDVVNKTCQVIFF